MKNLGRIEDPKDIITKEFLEGGIGARVNTLEDNVQMAESDIDTLQTDVQRLQTDNTATKAAVKTLQDTYVPNTRKVNGKALDADITIDTAFYVNATISETDQTVVILDKTSQEIMTARNNKLAVYCAVANENIGAYLLQLVSDDLSGGLQFISPYIVGVAMDFDNPKQIVIYETGNGLMSRWKIRYETLPTKTSQLTNDSGFLTSAPVESVNDKTGAVTLSATDVGAITKVSPSTEGNLPILTTSGELTDSGKKISDIGGGVFLVTVTDDEASGYNADKTFIEIKNAYDAGVVVLLKYNGLIYHQITYTPNIFVFSYSNYEGTKTFAMYTDSSVRSVDTKFVPDTRKINNKPLSSNITLTASDVGTVPATWTNDDTVNKLSIFVGGGGDVELGYLIEEDGYYYGNYQSNACIKAFHDGVIEVSAEPTTDMGIVNKKFLESNIRSIPIPDIKVATNVSCPLSAWVSDTTTYTNYQFKADLTVADATADYIPLVNFAPSEQESGNYIGATSGSGVVTIWCKSKPSGTITIPNIILTKEN